MINATGVLVHTNLGRAPWPASVAAGAAALATDYLLLELDRATGRRGARARVAEDHLVALTGAEDALITNNNAAAVALAVSLAGRGGGVVVSRGELVEIGGGVRIPDVIRRAGARLIEVGTTNRTRPADFDDALADGRARVVLRVHPSNFAMHGFTEAPDPAAVAEVAHARGAIVIDDLGSGALLDTAAFGLAHEPMPGERLAAGADLVTFSGDKLVGGPQAGYIVGRADLVARIRRDPLARAMRPDRVTMAAIALTLGLYRSGRAIQEIPIWRMLATSLDDLETRADGLVARLGSTVVTRVPLRSTVGGGALPGETVAVRRHRAAGRTTVGDARPGRAAPGRPDRHRPHRGGSCRARSAHGRPEPRRRAGRGGRASHRQRAMTVVVGTAGHIDHGKTTLLRALTGIDADRLPEERRRGMTIDVGYAHLLLDDGTVIDFVDVPGHDRLVGNMLVGAGEIDAALLVVAADDGPRAQTVEHLALLRAMGVPLQVVALTKIDAVAPERVAEVDALVRALVGPGVVIVPTSGTTGVGIDAVRAAVATMAAGVAVDRARPADAGGGSGLRGARPRDRGDRVAARRTARHR